MRCHFLSALLFSTSVICSLSVEHFEKIAGYQPLTPVRDQSYIDLDFEAIQVDLGYVKATNFISAERFYKIGAFSQVYAVLTLTGSVGVTSFIPKDTPVVGESPYGKPVYGTLMEDLDVGASTVKVMYLAPPPNAADHCQLGALKELSYEKTDGCLTDSWTLRIGESGTFTYSYDLEKDNLNGRTLQKFSTDAEKTMLLCDSCPHRMFSKFFNYYDVPDYGDRWITAAFEQGKTRMVRGNADFTEYIGSGRAEAVVHGILALNVWMQTVRKMEEAIDNCGDKNNDAVHPWDEAVAFYTGSSEGEDGNGQGHLLHAAADKRCAQFNTCGERGDNDSGRAKVTLDIFVNFALGQENLKNGNCKAAVETKLIIEDLMVVPLIQGVLYAAYQRDRHTDDELLQAEGATHVAAILPLMHECNPVDAEALYEQMKTGSSKPDFVFVKKLLERHYECMIGDSTCDYVGGLFDNSTQTYYPDAFPCGRHNDGAWVLCGILIFVSVIGFAACCICQRRKVKKSGRSYPDFPESIYPRSGQFT